jgi:hypothetical protein
MIIPKRLGKLLMKRNKFVILIILFAFLLPCTYGGCVVVFSSGDLDEDKDNIDDGSSDGFKGITSQAVITPINAEALAAGAFAGGLTSVVSQSQKLNQSSKGTQIDTFRPFRFPLVLGDSLRRVELAKEPIIFSRENVITQSDNFEGSCGGDFSSTLNFNRTSKRFGGNLSFRDYCDDGIIISGEIDVDGTFKASSGDFDTATFLFDDLSDGSHTLDGEISIDFSDTPILATFTAYSQDESTGQVYWIKDYSINLYELVGRIEIEIFGAFYHPDNGFVTLTTSIPFVVLDEDDWPISGQLIIQGDNDTEAQLIATDQLHFRIETDTEGDGVFDIESPPKI